jgi:plasmid stabilization system protein ParE
MRTWVLDRQAEAGLQAQLDYLIERGAVGAVEQLSVRVKAFLRDHLSVFPATGLYLDHRGLWETWIPRTRLVVWYPFTDEEVQVARVWHTAQDRQGAQTGHKPRS